MMKSTRNLVTTILVLLLALGVYDCVWKLHFKDRTGPFAENPLPDNVVGRTLTTLFRPLEELDHRQEQKRSLWQLCAKIEGHWKESGPIYYRGGAREVLIADTTITFINAPDFPNLHKKTFEIEVYQKRFSCVSIDGRPFKFETTTYFDGERLRITETDGEHWLRNLPLLSRIDVTQKANKEEMATPRKPSD